ncbi:MAG: methyltransferase domain-containing protein [Terriglobia bacterium]
MRRTISRELLDDDIGHPAELKASLHDLWRLNRQFGGVSGSLGLLDRVLARTGAQQVRIMDAGAGDGRLAGWLQQELARRGLKTCFCALDQRISHLSFWRPSPDPIQRVAASAMELPFREGAFDVVMCNLFVHHFSGEALHKLLREMVRVSKTAVLVNDLERRWLPYLFIRYAPFVAHSPLTRPDGAASVRQAYTRRELAALAAGCGASSSEVMALPFFRLGVILWKNHLHAAM